ncbi:MAG: extracellular solute-binding protein [Verrucomicrobia bacterium]|nr:extracellular solute-binding protein [Verrucomicrobiota bacterium]
MTTRHLLASLIFCSLCALPASSRAEGQRLDLKGKTIRLSVLGVAGWLPSKLPVDMAPEFAKYAAEKYGYHVSFTYADAPFSTLFQKAASSLATKSNEYSLIVSDSQWLGAFTEPGWIVKLDDTIKQNPDLNPEWYHPVLVSSYMEYPDNSGHKVALPQETDVLVLFVRKDLFQNPAERDAYKQQTGRELPQTFEDWEKVDFDEFKAISKFFTRPDKGLYGTCLQHSKEYDFESMTLYPIQWSAGGEFWNPKTHDVEGYLNTPVNAKGLEIQKSFLEVEPPGAVNYGIAENIDAFTQGKVATAQMWAAVGLAMITPQNRDKVMVVPSPGIKQADGSIKRLYCIGGQSWVINNYATPEQKQAILDFLKWWYLPETQLEFAKKGGNPAVKATLEDPNFDSINPWNRAMKFMIPFNRDFYHSPKYAELLAIQQEAFTSYVTGAVNDPMKALNWAAARQQQVLYDLGDTEKKPTTEYLRLQLK